MVVTIYRFAILPALPNLDIPNIPVILDSFSGLPTHATHDKIAALATHSSLDSINTIISFTIHATFPTVAKIIILATLPTQPIMAISWFYQLILAGILLLLLLVTICTLSTRPVLANLDIPNILVILDSLPGLPTHATPDNIAVLATHSSLETINSTISFTTPATFPTVASLIILATLTAQQILANLLILSTNSSLYTSNIIGCHHI